MLKVERAKHHITNLETTLAAYVAASKERLIAQGEIGPRKQVGTLTTPVPRHTPTILGDAIHNLRAALDHAYCVLIEANGHTYDSWSKFPFSKQSIKDLKGSINGQITARKGPSKGVRDLIVDVIQLYPGGNGSDLQFLHDLDIADKHTVLLSTVIRLSNVTVMIPEIRMQISGVVFESDRYGWFSVDDGMTHVIDYNSNPTFEICFERGQPFEGRGIIDTLNMLHGRVTDTLHRLAHTGGVPLE